MKFRAFIKSHIWLSVAVVTVVIGLGLFLLSKRGGDDIETKTIEATTFLRTVSVAGKVIPAREVELGFESSGRVAAVYKEVGEKVFVGQTLAVLSSADIVADISKAEADLEAERTRLAELKIGSEGISGTELRNAEKELDEASYDAFVRSDDAIRNNVDQFYSDGEIVFAFDDYELRKELNEKRREIRYVLDKWVKDSYNAKLAETNLAIIKSFLDRVALAVNDFQVEGSDYTQTEIDKFKSDVSSARSSINLATSNMIKARESIRAIESEIPYQEAKVRAAEADVAGLKAELGKKVITAPFSGVITILDAKVGNIVPANDPVITLISSNTFQIETFVPEINISEVKVGNNSKVTLDAYGEEVIFDAKVIMIDPAETERDGVSTYKVTFEFTNEDDRLRSGMTANVVITTETKENTISVPQGSIFEKNGFKNVLVKVGDEYVEKQVTTGSVSVNGDIEIVSGVSVGEVLVLYPDKVNNK